jgi:hypothetical protein
MAHERALLQCALGAQRAKFQRALSAQLPEFETKLTFLRFLASTFARAIQARARRFSH